MDTYSLMREFADSWMLLFMFTFFVGIIIWVIFGRRSKFSDSANIVFRHDDKPLSQPDAPCTDSEQEARS